jgi:hypothetical protein
MAIDQTATGNDSVAVTGRASAGERTIGVKGIGDSTGVHGEGKDWNGVEGTSASTIGGFGVFGANTAGGTGVCGVSTGWMGVYGKSDSTTGGAGVMGEGSTAPGVIGTSQTWMGVYGKTASTVGGAGVMGESTGTGAGVYGKGGRVAGYFEGDVEVTGDIRLTNADCAEDFDIGVDEFVTPGTVMVLGDDGALFPSQRAYDKCVAGVVSGGGGYKPGIVLDKNRSDGNRQPIALLGKVYCLVDAACGAIEVGDLLTTSPTAGHAMKAADPFKAFGAVIGKALGPLKEGQRLLPILIALQ